MVLVFPAVTQWFRGLWSFYRSYTNTATHTAAAAALTIFGILVFVDPWFAVIAIASYVVPPVVLYVLTDEPIRGVKRPESEAEGSPSADRPVESTTAGTNTDHSSDGGVSRSKATVDVGNGDTDTDSDDGDTGSDSDDGDTDFDATGTDTDSDSDGRGTDTDTDRDDGDTDSDSDG
ncbi:hypothetical protein [Halopiger djelfimassiliensis]|uniref:hypothetical protein n=1 Tax=Halopiger djelfimassiliensis TaxID=1293047 RepID=UPI000677EE64|nr:hypothetical protein [Halopiger djelfimassiliensis]